MATMEQAKRPVTPLAGPYGHPVHPAVVAVPIGSWTASAAFDVGSHLVGNPGFLAEGSRWLIAIGVLGALVAAVFGFLDLLAVPSGTRAFRTALVHMSLNLVVVVVFAVDFLARGTHPVAPVPVPLVVLSVLALAVLSVSGYLGGLLAFRYGVRVADEDTQAEGYQQGRPSTASGGTAHQPSPAGRPGPGRGL